MSDATPPPSSAAPSGSVATSSITIVIIVASAVIVSASIYILLRFRRSPRTFSADDVVPSEWRAAPPSALLDSLPIFTFGSVTGNLTGGDCAVCLLKFQPRDRLRLLPFCCHAFHAACIDDWIVEKQTCPLCRSTVLPSDADVLEKTLPPDRPRSGSFRVEIGSVSRRGEGSADGERQSYSIGPFDYVLSDSGREVSIESDDLRRVISGEDKEVSGRRNWLRDYVDRLSIRSSGRFFSGSSRRSDVVFPAEDVEVNRAGEEISELFRWLSGV